ncbi:unnamed protein product [Rotaria sp. Silwood2]|nr:unnamed protein product [Rotaria sp. Silwood2]CAF4283277.1 unnamed protein product [Rotaria sp. Silwood2]
MEDHFQFEDFDNPQLLATNNRDQQITIVAANDKIKRTKNEQQVIKENNLREPNQQKSIEQTHLDIIPSGNDLLTITFGPVNMLDAESYKITCSLGTWAVGGTLIMIKTKHEVLHVGTDPINRFAFIKTTYNNIPIVIVIVNVYAPAQITERSKAHFTYYKFNQNRIQFLDHPTKGRVKTDLEMLELATDFYKDLYDVKTVDTTIWNELFTGLPTLNPIDMICLEHDIGYAKCHNTLKIMPLGRVPGEDGITIEVWRYLFPIIGEYYVRMINVAKCNGHFHDGFLNAMLTFLKQEGNNNGSMKGFRSLSLMHIDYKILSKVLNVHLKKF